MKYYVIDGIIYALAASKEKEINDLFPCISCAESKSCTGYKEMQEKVRRARLIWIEEYGKRIGRAIIENSYSKNLIDERPGMSIRCPRKDI